MSLFCRVIVNRMDVGGDDGSYILFVVSIAVAKYIICVSLNNTKRNHNNLF